MEKKIVLSKKQIINGTVKDTGGNDIKSGEFEVLRDRDNTLTLRSKDGRIFKIPKNQFVMNGDKGKDEEGKKSRGGQSGGQGDSGEPSEGNEGDCENEEEQEGEGNDKCKGKKSKPSMGTSLTEVQQLETETEIIKLIEAGIKNIWMVGPAGCGKTTMCKNVATQLSKPFLLISCSIGTSAAEFVGYKYPTPRATQFGEYFRKPGIIVLDEFPVLDPAVAQVTNAALANGYIYITTSDIPIHRHNECIIIATSNTFGNGADPQYVANQQLDASTIDRFVGGMINVDYSPSHESRYDPDVLKYVLGVRKCINSEYLRRIASTRMLIEGEKLKKYGFEDWRARLISNWTKEEKETLTTFLEEYFANGEARKELKPKLNDTVELEEQRGIFGF